MRSGIEWHEQDRPLDETNTTVQLEKSVDWIGFTLSQPMEAEPDTKWVYSSGGSQLLSGVVHSATKQHIDDCARANLFEPIGVRQFHWKKTPTGHADAEGGLYLSAEDTARIGYLYLHDGVWNGRRILPPGWVKEATTRHVFAVAPGWDYGYQWWVTSRAGADIWAGRGFGGQRAIQTYEQGLLLARQNRERSFESLDPSWGEAEQLMNLAGASLRDTPPNVAMAERYAQQALALVPYWRSVREGLMPRILRAKGELKH